MPDLLVSGNRRGASTLRLNFALYIACWLGVSVCFAALPSASAQRKEALKDMATDSSYSTRVVRQQGTFKIILQTAGNSAGIDSIEMPDANTRMGSIRNRFLAVRTLTDRFVGSKTGTVVLFAVERGKFIQAFCADEGRSSADDLGNSSSYSLTFTLDGDTLPDVALEVAESFWQGGPGRRPEEWSDTNRLSFDPKRYVFYNRTVSLKAGDRLWSVLYKYSDPVAVPSGLPSQPRMQLRGQDFVYYNGAWYFKE